MLSRVANVMILTIQSLSLLTGNGTVLNKMSSMNIIITWYAIHG